MLAYLHIPFCDSKCHYCAFNSYDNKSGFKQTYMQRIVEQLKNDLARFDVKPNEISSLFIGGGTPSSVEASLYAPFFELLFPYLSEDVEITSEANPHSATLEWLNTMKHFGVNRFSFGVQSFNEQKLAFLGRNHTQKSALLAIENAHKIGIKNISLDLIYGTTLDTPELLHEDLRLASILPINHLSAYALTLEEKTPFYTRHDVQNPSEELARSFVSDIIGSGFPQYEISNFGTYQSRHNKGYWEHQNYLGMGAGAVGFLHNQRFYPHKEIEAYLKNPLEYEIEALNEEDLHIEKIFLGLRSMIGIALTEFNAKEHAKIAILLQENKLVQKENRIYNTDYFLSDEIALYITQ